MAKRVVWRAGDLLSIKLRDNLFTIAQMLGSPVMRFFDIFNATGVWKDIDLNTTPILFRVLVGRVINRHLIREKIKTQSVIPCSIPDESLWIDVYTIMDEGHYPEDKDCFAFMGGKIISTDPKAPFYTQAVVRHDLSLPEDKEVIERLELTNMWGDDDLADRLCRYHDTGINRDDLKFEVFPGLWNDREKLRPLTRRLPVPLR